MMMVALARRQVEAETAAITAVPAAIPAPGAGAAPVRTAVPVTASMPTVAVPAVAMTAAVATSVPTSVPAPVPAVTRGLCDAHRAKGHDDHRNNRQQNSLHCYTLPINWSEDRSAESRQPPTRIGKTHAERRVFA